MINPKLFLFMYGLVFWCISGLKGKKYQYFAVVLTSLKQQTSELQSRAPFTPHWESLGRSFESLKGKPGYSSFFSYQLAVGNEIWSNLQNFRMQTCMWVLKFCQFDKISIRTCVSACRLLRPCVL